MLVVQNNVGTEHSPTIIVAPITGKLRKNPLPTHVSLPHSCGLSSDSLVLAEQIRTIDRSCLGSYIGRVSGSLQTAIDKTLAVCVGLEGRQSPKDKMLVLSLCRRCESDFRDSGYVLVKQGWQEECGVWEIETKDR